MDLNQPPAELRAAYAELEPLGHRVVEVLAAHLANVETLRVSNTTRPADLEAQFVPIGRAPLAASAANDPEQPVLLAELERIIAAAQHVHHPRFIGHQVAAPLPIAALTALTNAVLNNSSAVFEMGPVGVVLERHVVRFMTDAIGWGAAAGGVLTHGGSIGNLTALLAMRQAQSQRQTAGMDPWRDGGDRFAVLASADSHYCIARAAQIMGWGSEGVARVQTDASGALDVADLERALLAARAQGRRVLGVAASACTTALGAFDDLEALADFCAKHALWLHVDAAHGGPFLLSDQTRDRLRGIERADSVVWDLHKMMLMPSLITGVLYKDGRHAAAALAQDASYLFKAGAEAEYDLGHSTLECTKPTIGVTAYLTLALHGTDFFGRYVERCVALAQQFAERVRAHRSFELAADPQGNIVCFRHVGSAQDAGNADALDALQEDLRARLVAEGHAYIVLATVRGARYLRTTIINPFTTTTDLAGLLMLLDDLARGA